MSPGEFAQLLGCTPVEVDEIARALCDGSRPDPYNSQFQVVRRNGLGRGLILKISSRLQKVYFSFYTYSNRDYRVGLRTYLVENNVISAEGVDFDGVRGVVAENRANTDNGTVCYFYPTLEIRHDEVLQRLNDLLAMKRALIERLNRVNAFTVAVPPAQHVVQGEIQVVANGNVAALVENQVVGGNLMRNKIVFGAPGTGKSHSLKAAYEGDGAPFLGRYERVTFYPTYSYAQFVGAYKPIMKPDTQHPGEEKIAYQFVPGPFLRMLVKAANNPDQNYLLIIEEINRANAAAVFGDVFQLLDRTDEGESEYHIGASEDVVRYLNGAENGNPILSLQGKKFFGMVRKIQEAVADGDLAPENWTSTGECKLRLPKNLYIWATMNSADQGVFPLDTAFKRRWEFEYIGVNAEENEGECPTWRIDGSNYRWNEVRKFINDLLSVHGVNEDKLMGPFFVKARQDNDGNYSIPQRQFEAKVLMYLWEDAARMFRRQMFGEVKTYSQLLERWRSQNGGIRVFGQDNALGAEVMLRNRYEAFLNSPPAQPNPPNDGPQPQTAGQP